MCTPWLVPGLGSSYNDQKQMLPRQADQAAGHQSMGWQSLPGEIGKDGSGLTVRKFPSVVHVFLLFEMIL